MKFLKLSGLAVLSAALLTLSCQKRGDFEVECKIQKIISKYQSPFEGDPLEENISTFSYNAWGDPVSILQSVPTTGRPNYHFYYDNQHRLISFTGVFEDGTPDGLYDFLTRYKYGSNNYVVSDTTWYWEQIFPPNTFNNYIVNTYTYDSKGRVSKVHRKPSNTPQEFDVVYNYDANDNLITGATYDNKVNFLRTNLVLAFVTCNYSKNNAVPALGYNSKKLPTAYGIAGTGSAYPSFFSMPVTEIQYSCDAPGYNH